MQFGDVRPGKDFVVCERLGKGRWKEVYRAIQKRGLRDVALLRFIKPPLVSDLMNELRLLEVDRPVNVAELYRVFEGDDKSIYLVEELMYRPLDKIAPLGNVERFIEIACGLLNGLWALHSRDLIHRDLKLENCGMDFSERAKLFDLGSVTSADSTCVGSVLTRSPELFVEDAGSTKASDVWALGATLYALRTGTYPFVTAHEWRNRPAAGTKRATERSQFEATVRDRALRVDAEDNLFEAIEDAFPGPVCQMMRGLLCFAPGSRPTAEVAREQWLNLAHDWLGVADKTEKDQVDNGAAILELEQFLRGVLDGQVGLSPRQWTMTVDAVERIRQTTGRSAVSKLDVLLAEVQAQRSNEGETIYAEDMR